MTTHQAKRGRNRALTYPGEILREDVLPALDMPVVTAAISPAMALRLREVCGNGPEIWPNMQRAYDLWRAEREMADEIAKISTHRVARGRFNEKNRRRPTPIPTPGRRGSRLRPPLRAAPAPAQ